VGPASSLTPDSEDFQFLGPVLPDTLRVLVLRVAFPSDEDPTTTGDGSFDMRSLETFESEEGHVIDAAPHDRGYVGRHLQALHHYWWAASDGALSLSAGIYPSGEREAYQVPHPISHYGFESPLGSIEEAMSTLVTEAVRAAEAAAGSGGDLIDWTAWDAFVIFHAGADWQGDAAGAGDTPADIPTAYIALGDPVAVGGTWVRDATIVPETVSQDGWTGAINGILAHEFGHQLGLLDLYDVPGNDTAVGHFALMDLGDAIGGVIDDRYVFGLLPAGLSPWSRLYMGWAEAADPGPDGILPLVASTALAGVHDLPSGSKVGRVRAGESQWFLAEYRADDLDGETGVSLFWDQGVVDGTAVLVGEEKVRTFEYDALLPGSGVLIWHLDEGVARLPSPFGGTNFEANSLQGDRLRRFLDVEEADGLQELGWVPGYYGAPGDFWGPGAGNNDGPALFGPATEPGTGSWTGAATGLRLDVTAGASPLGRTVTVTSEAPAPLFTVPFPHPSPTASVPWLYDPGDGAGPRVAVLDGLGGLHLFTLTGDAAAGPNPVWTAPEPSLFPLTRAGDRWVVTAGDSLWYLDEAGGVAAAVDLGAPAVLRPAAREVPHPGVVVALAGGRIVELDAAGALAGSNELPGEVGAMTLVGGGCHLCAASGSALYSVSTMGYTSQIAIFPFTPIVEVVGVDPIFPQYAWGLVIHYGTGRLYFRPELVIPIGYTLPGIGPREQTLAGPKGPPAVGRLGYEGVPVVALATTEGPRLFQFDGTPVAGWPPRPGGRAAAPTPWPEGDLFLLADVGLVGLSPEGEIGWWDAGGNPIASVAETLPHRPFAPPTLAWSEEETGSLLLAVTEPDSLRLLPLPLPVPVVTLEVDWSGPQGGPGGRNALTLARSEPVGGDAPIDFYTYPNPARDLCTVRAEGLAGTLRIEAFTRTGTRLGRIAVLESLSPAAREAVWDVSDLAPGAYFLVGELERPDGSRTRVRTTVLVVR